MTPPAERLPPADHHRADRAHRAADGPEQGGDAACWLSAVCPDCGRLADVAPPVRCAGCGAEIAVD